MTPRRKALFVVAVLVVLVSLGGTAAVLMGWSLAAPEGLPVAAAPAEPAADAGSFETEGARFGAQIDAAGRVTLWREDGADVRVWPVGFSDGPFEAKRDGDYLRVSAPANVTADGERTATLRLAVYRHAALGFWRADDRVLTFTY